MGTLRLKRKKPAMPDGQSVEEYLTTHYPQLFKNKIPLALGIFDELTPPMVSNTRKKRFKRFLRDWTGRVSYQKAMLRHRCRYDINLVKTPISDEHLEGARLRLIDYGKWSDERLEYTEEKYAKAG